MDMVTAAMGRTGAAYKPGPSRYPHIALGSTTDAADVLDAVTLRASLASIEKSLTGTVLADSIHLVEQWHDGRHIRWNPIAEIPLGTHT
ncbi:hypothetical protein ACFQ7J_01860 [Streptomyces sp. NPDC056501]|uniref:hypothetical protein n=1 Tax=Streptomyces sp. NPDC056501 TaxID=3345841 RepID=UPI0036CE12F9